MNQQQRDSILQAAIHHYGPDAQMMKLCEEAGELIQAVVKFLANRNETTLFNLMDECADMTVMLAQMPLMSPYIAANIKGRVEYKLDRLADMVAGEKCNG